MRGYLPPLPSQQIFIQKCAEIWPTRIQRRTLPLNIAGGMKGEVPKFQQCSDERVGEWEGLWAKGHWPPVKRVWELPLNTSPSPTGQRSCCFTVPKDYLQYGPLLAFSDCPKMKCIIKSCNWSKSIVKMLYYVIAVLICYKTLLILHKFKQKLSFFAELCENMQFSCIF